MSRPWLALSLAVAAVVCALALFAVLSGPKETETVTVYPVSGCALHQGPCFAELPDGRRLSFGVTPRSLPLMRPLTLTVSFAPPGPATVSVTVTGANMDMGVQHADLAPAPGGYQGHVTLPVCSHRQMDWRALVRVGGGDGNWVVPFEFSTSR